MNQRGFSLIQVMLAGLLMIGLAWGVHYLISNQSKTEDEVAHRLRYHDLVDDLRFLFDHPVMCEESLKSLEKTQTVRLNPSVTLAAGDILRDYGIRLTNFSTKEVFQTALRTRNVKGADGKPGPAYQETCRVVEVSVDAMLIGSDKPLKTEQVARVASIFRTGAVEASYCYRLAEGQYCPP